MLIRHDPWKLIKDLGQFFENDNLQHTVADTKEETPRWAPAVDLKEGPEKYALFVDVPGVDAKDIEISMENNILTIKGARNEVSKDEKESYTRLERRFGQFQRRFTLPENADAEQISAKTKHGVLEITIEKKKTAQPRKIEISCDD